MQQHIERIAKGSSMPRNGKEGILFSFIMSAIMIYVMAALNYGVRIGDVGAAAWSYALFNWPLAYVVGIICDLCICTPSSRAIMNTFCAATYGTIPIWNWSPKSKPSNSSFIRIVFMPDAKTSGFFFPHAFRARSVFPYLSWGLRTICDLQAAPTHESHLACPLRA